MVHEIQLGLYPALYASWVPDDTPHLADYSSNKDAYKDPYKTGKASTGGGFVSGWGLWVLRYALSLGILLLVLNTRGLSSIV